MTTKEMKQQKIQPEMETQTNLKQIHQIQIVAGQLEEKTEQIVMEEKTQTEMENQIHG